MTLGQLALYFCCTNLGNFHPHKFNITGFENLYKSIASYCSHLMLFHIEQPNEHCHRSDYEGWHKRLSYKEVWKRLKIVKQNRSVRIIY